MFTLSMIHLGILGFSLTLVHTGMPVELVFHSMVDASLVFAALAIVAILVAYPVIIYKLVKQGQLRQSTSNANRSKHITAVKVFIALFLILIVSYIPTRLVRSETAENFYVTYLYFVNHVGNPLVYYAINKTYRSDVNQLIGGLVSRFRA